MAETTSIPNLVVVGSSAGGIDALTTLLGGLPKDFSAPIVIAQHLDPNRPSHLGGILARRSPLPVVTVTDNDPLAASTIYVVPANRDVRITDTHIELTEDDSHISRSKPSVDILFNSAAEAFGERLIAVILSGMGSDGAAGARVVKKGGGTVIIQDPTTAAFPSMPLALAPTTVDIIANVDKIGAILHDLLAGNGVPTRPVDRQRLSSFLDEIRERYGLDFSEYKTPTIMRRLQRRIVATDSDDLVGYSEYLRAHPEEYRQLINSFLIKVTEFFRDPDLFTYLRETIIPDLVTQARKRDNELRIWSAGCATGEEAYSLAIILSEVLGAALEQFNVRIFATDADPGAIAFARRGIYPAPALAHVPEELVAKYFTREDGNFQIKKRVRGLAVFGQHDLGGSAPFPHIDLVLCRNVLIYFTPVLQRQTLNLFAYSLHNGGYLVLGKAETPSALSEYFAPVDKVHRAYSRQGGHIFAPPPWTSEHAPAPPQRLTFAHRAPGGASGLSGGQRDVQRVRDQADLLLRVPVGIVVVDHRYDIQTINNAARQFLSIHSPAIGEDLIHISQGVSQPQLREAIDQAFRNRAPVTIGELAVENLIGDESRYLQISCHPHAADGEGADDGNGTGRGGSGEMVTVVLQDVTMQVQARKDAERLLLDTNNALDQLRRETNASASSREMMIHRLVETNRQLIAANQELTGANEELRGANEEFLLTAEEAQSAIEEVETLNEEMQATNEELETLNEELQATVEELNATNDDLNARSTELQHLAETSEQERARLEAILRSLSDAVVVVNGAGAPVLTNAAYDKMFASSDALLHGENEDGHPLPAEQMPLGRAARGESFSMEFIVTQADGARRWYEANGEPISSGDRAREVVAIRDITERSLHRLQDEFVALASHELRAPLTSAQAALQMLDRLRTESPPDPQVSHLTELALRQVTRLTRLVSDLLDARRLQSGKFGLRKEPFQLDEAVSRAVEATETLASGTPIRVQMADTSLTIDGDAGRVEQVVLNLLTNAITHASGGQQIDVRVRRRDGEAEVQVQDYGEGIAAADLPHVFTRFYQMEHGNTGGQQGLGLGLYIAREIIEAHGGTIGVTSTPGHGATFTIRLPLA